MKEWFAMATQADITQLDDVALAAYLSANMPGFVGPLTVKKFNTGQSNPTYLIEAKSGRYVLRRKPPGVLLKSAHAVDREFRVMKALAATNVPVPNVRVLCEDDGIIGTSFFVMDHVDGRIFWDPALPELSKADRSGVYDQMNATLAALHSVDPASVGLADFGKPGSYFERQLSRWTQQYRASETVPLPDMERLISWLSERVPADDGRISIVHGDYRIDNMMFAPSAPKVVAVLDWELSTLGHPFSDLAYQCMHWRLPHEGHRGLQGVDRKALGIPSEEDYVALYCQRMGLSKIEGWTFCLAFSFFRLAAIIQGVLKRALDGNGSNPEHGKAMGKNVPVLARMAIELIEAKDEK
jgi:aminoglycoside phosphotransferase (APT) family kinase protein